MITIYTSNWYKPYAQGLVRDLRIRWALEEASIPYQVKIVAREDMKSPAHLARQPFGAIPVFEEDGFTLFESGAILLHVAERSEMLMPRDKGGKATTVAWVFAAINTVEHPIENLCRVDLFPSHPEIEQGVMRPTVEGFVKERLCQLAAYLGAREYLLDRFTVADIAMATVLRYIRHTDLVAREPNLKAYLTRCESRPAFQRALDAHMSEFKPA